MVAERGAQSPMTESASRSAMRISYLGQDRADVQEAAKCLSRRMQSPTQADLVELKRAVRYLLKFHRAVFGL